MNNKNNVKFVSIKGADGKRTHITIFVLKGSIRG